MDLILNKPNILNVRFLSPLYFLNGRKLSSHMDGISEHPNYKNHKTNSYDQIIKMIVNLVSKKGDINDK